METRSGEDQLDWNSSRSNLCDRGFAASSLSSRRGRARAFTECESRTMSEVAADRREYSRDSLCSSIPKRRGHVASGIEALLRVDRLLRPGRRAVNRFRAGFRELATSLRA